ncbi:AAA family ATPase [Kitasatospora sp. NPDC058444]|uniref:AAA family ATPase n=1 Tax=Kitasatospora sp. NPDC058444 TaxID=3346504 RepID=UPI003665B144
MVGRDRERARLSAFVQAVDGQALVLRGEAGVGKSALLDLAVQLAVREGHLVIRATGVEAESELPYAGLHQLVYPLLPDGGPSEGRQPDAEVRAALDAVFSRTGAPPPSVMALGIAVLDLLSSTAAKRPLLLVLDDGQWLDDASAEVCGIIGRRLAGSPGVKLLVAVRGDIPSRFDTAALPEMPVGALADATCLLDRHHPELGKQFRAIVLDQARGNPLALVELPAHIAARHGGQGPDDLLGGHDVSLPRRIQEIYAARLARLGDSVRAELLTGALDGATVRSGDGSAPRTGRYRMRGVEEAVACGLLVVEPASGDLAFRHPLVRTSVVQLATMDQRRAAHRVLAHVHREDPERRALHLAAATVDPDEDVAAVLEAAARSATRTGGALMAVSWLTRAAELSENRADRSRRLGDAAFVAAQADRLGQAHGLALAASAHGSEDDPAAVLANGYLALYRDGDVWATHRQVAAAVERLCDGGAADRPGIDRHRSDRPDADRDDEVLNRLVGLLLAVSQYAGSRSAWERTHEVLASLGDPGGVGALASLGDAATERASMYGGTWSDVVRHGAGWSEPVERAAAGLEDQEPWDVTRLAVSAYHLDVLSPLRPHLERMVDRELDTGAASSGIVMLHLIMLDQTALGQWEAAERTGRRALALAAEHGHALFAYQTRAYLAQLAAVRGRVKEARDLQTAVDAWARPRAIGFLTQIADAVGATTALSAGDHETAFLHAIGITAPGAFRPYAHQASRTLLDLVEAALGTGREEQARAHALAARDAGLPDISPRLALLTYGVLAMTADDEEEAADMYARAQSHPAGERFPFELARIRLAHGIRVRRTQGGAAARAILAPAAETFDRLGATAWAERAQAELRAAGVASRAPAPAAVPLTWQERRVAELAAGGLTNKEIGEQMRLSPRTVSAHLYRAFPKLGITTRAALRDALTRMGDCLSVP